MTLSRNVSILLFVSTDVMCMDAGKHATTHMARTRTEESDMKPGPRTIPPEKRMLSTHNDWKIKQDYKEDKRAGGAGGDT